MRSLSVVIPAYNESGAIAADKLAPVISWCRQRGDTTELLIVDDGSDDGTGAALRAASLEVIEIPHGGKAAAIMAGVAAARGEWVLFTDMDQATPISYAQKLLDALESGADIAIGSRGLSRTGAPPGRYIMSLGHLLLRRLILGAGWKDTQCGFKAFRRHAALETFGKMVVFCPSEATSARGPSVTSGFDVEFLLVAERMGFKIREVPVAWHYQNTRRVGKIRDSWRGFRDLLAIASAAGRREYP